MRYLWALSLFLGFPHFALSFKPSRLTCFSFRSPTYCVHADSDLPNKKGNSSEAEKYMLRAKILEEALLVMRDRFEKQESPLSVSKAEDVANMKYMLDESEDKRCYLERSLNETQKKFNRYKKRTDILERALSKSREKAQEVEIKMKNVLKSKREVEGELKEVKADNERLTFRLQEYEEELANVRNDRNARQKYNVEVARLERELENARLLIQSLETEYSNKIADMEATIETAKRNEAVEREHLEHLELMVQSARADVADLHLTIEKNEKLISKLKARETTEAPSVPVETSTEALESKLAETSQLLESTIVLLRQAAENSIDHVQDRVQERVGNQGRDSVFAGEVEGRAELMERELFQRETISFYGRRSGHGGEQSQPLSGRAESTFGREGSRGVETSRSRVLPAYSRERGAHSGHYQEH